MKIRIKPIAHFGNRSAILVVNVVLFHFSNFFQSWLYLPPTNITKRKCHGQYQQGISPPEIIYPVYRQQGTNGSRNFIKYMNQPIHLTQLNSISSNNISGYYTSHQLNHSMKEPQQRINEIQKIGRKKTPSFLVFGARTPWNSTTGNQF